MTYRMALALVALVDSIVALYLHLWKIGLAGTLSCGQEHGCEVVQLSSYGWFLGVDVALIGAVGWAAVFVVAVLGTLPRWEDARWPTAALSVLVYPALLFTLRLKYGEFVVLRSFCPWCAINAVIVVVATVLVTLDWRRLRSRG
ncbi:vitamin K epoxide reductase family protein [Roseisolibacter sp. H3M3-2]|uniref:vitamin K epoxide reductase family protein n=1 Tax=Roseisolibacter sp. H3M3-2 TaxID=3031323 RepID=UPI0023DCEA52|nr:vitamin K epoxide reductase family protein [Roseisolibacter sp. H3M3-2]MDF1502612.1 vitamin K epoxide reductase family protein [Roseisolibacter sp. H3M3-2]